MKRASLKAVVLAAAVIAGATAGIGTAGAELPTPEQGGPAELIRYVGDPSSATGNAISNGPCDIDGDGVDDAVVGAWFWDKAPTTNIGAAYVLFGGTEARGGSLASPAEAGAVRIDGPAVQGATVAFAVACTGDVNGDGFDDLAITYYGALKTYVVYGAEDFTGLTLDSLGDRGFAITGPPAGNFGFSAARVGDLNDDGLADFAVAEVVADTQGRTNNGRVWVLAGRDDISDVNLNAPAAGQVLLTVDGALAEERIGNIASVGDVNGDGIDDFLLGAYTSTPWGSGLAVPGAAYVVFGGPTATGAIDAADLGTKGFTIVGPTRQRDRLGISVSGAGDIDGDGKADLLIGADGVANAATGTRNGGAAVVFGSASTDRVYTDPLAANGNAVFTCAAPAPVLPTDTCTSPARRGYWIDGAVAADSTGYSVAGIGDVNGDDVPDLALGAYGFDPANPAGGTFSGGGAVYVQFGQPDAVTQSLAAQTAAEGYRIDGTLNGDRFGRQVGAIGDFDGNGTPDLVVGADFAARNGGSQNGELTVALMGKLVTEVALGGPTASLPGAELTYTAAVTKAVGDQTPLAAGTVAFTLGGTPITGCEAVAVVDGEAECAATFATEVTGDVVATYSGTERLQGAPSDAVALTVAKAPSATTVAGPASALPGADATFTATVTTTDAGQSPVAAGTVDFTLGGTAIDGCTAVPVVAGEAPCTAAFVTETSGDVVAAYSGTATLAATSSAAHPFTVAKAASTTTLSGPATAAIGAEVTFAATVATTDAGQSPVAAGTVDFTLGGTAISGCSARPVSAGTASCTVTFPGAVSGDVVATYAGTATLAGSASAPRAFTIAAVPTPADEAWTKAAYEDFLGRAPSATELTTTVARLTAGTSRTTLAKELSSSDEWIRVSIRKFFLDTLDREPDVGGLAYWTNQVKTGKRTLAQVAAQFYSSSEYYANAGGTDADWVKDLYVKVLGRTADAAGLSYWTGRTASKGRLSVATSIYGSTESRRDRVTFLYDELLGRAPDAAGLAYWANRIATTGDLALAVNLATSPEYGNRAQVRFP